MIPSRSLPIANTRGSLDSVPSANQGKILVVRGGAIGDFILTLPAIRAIRKSFPEAELEILGYPHIAHLALEGHLVDAVRSIDARPMAGFFARAAPLDPRLAGYFSQFEVIISYLYDPDHIFQDNVRRCAKPKSQFIQARHRPDENEERHATEVFLQALESLAIFDACTTPRLDVERRLSPLDPACPDRRWLAVHPGSGSEKKNWPEAFWTPFLKRLVTLEDWGLLLVGGEAEMDRLQRLQDALPSPRVLPVVGKPLSELARDLRACQVFVGHDSGITHLAAAVGLPCLVLWAASKASIWQPRGQQILRLDRTPHPDPPDPEHVHQALRQLLDLSP